MIGDKLMILYFGMGTIYPDVRVLDDQIFYTGEDIRRGTWPR